MADAVLPSIPGFILRGMLNYLPSAAFSALRVNRKLSTQVSEELMSEKTEALKLGLEADKDLLTVLVRANIKNQGTGRLTGPELGQQIPSVVIAGQGATVCYSTIKYNMTHVTLFRVTPSLGLSMSSPRTQRTSSSCARKFMHIPVRTMVNLVITIWKISLNSTRS